MRNIEEVKSTVHQWTLDHFPLAREKDVNTSDSLLESGIVDSLGTLDIVMFIEEQFGVVVQEEDMIAENFESVEAITSLVERKHSG